QGGLPGSCNRDLKGVCRRKPTLPLVPVDVADPGARTHVTARVQRATARDPGPAQVEELVRSECRQPYLGRTPVRRYVLVYGGSEAADVARRTGAIGAYLDGEATAAIHGQREADVLGGRAVVADGAIAVGPAACLGGGHSLQAGEGA